MLLREFVPSDSRFDAGGEDAKYFLKYRRKAAGEKLLDKLHVIIIPQTIIQIAVAPSTPSLLTFDGSSRHYFRLKKFVCQLIRLLGRFIPLDPSDSQSCIIVCTKKVVNNERDRLGMGHGGYILSFFVVHHARSF